MPRTTPLSESQREICDRLRVFREEHLLLSRVAFARQLGVDSVRIASHEHGRVPLRYGLADQIGLTFDLNQVWLAEGQMDMTPYLPPPPALLGSLDPKELFSTVYVTHLRSVLTDYRRFDSLYGAIGLLHSDEFKSPSQSSMSSLLDMALHGVREKFQQCAPELRLPFIRALIHAALRGGAQKTQNLLLTNTSTGNNLPRVRTLQALLQRADVLAKGKKSDLARLLDVAPETLSRYFSGTIEPGGATALKLLNWVEEQERKTKQARTR